MERQTHKKRGRPTKYDERYVGELIAYFESFVDKPFTKEVLKEETFFHQNGSKKTYRVEFKFVAKRLPTLFGFARGIKVDYSTVFRWATERIGDAPKEGQPDRRPYRYPDFRNAYKSRELYQTEFLTALGLGGVTPPAAYIFTAKNVIGWRDAVDQRFVDGQGKDRAAPGYVLLPPRGQAPADDVAPAPDAA